MENFAEIFALITLAWAIVQSALNYRAIPREAWDKFMDSYNERAARTAWAFDDKVGKLVDENVTPLFERAGIFDDIESKNADNPLVGLPESKPLIDPAIRERIEAPIENVG